MTAEENITKCSIEEALKDARLKVKKIHPKKDDIFFL